MRRAAGLGLLWAALAAVATFVAWQGVAVVGDQVTDRPSPALAAPAGLDPVPLPATTTTIAHGTTTTSAEPPSPIATPPTAPSATGSGQAGGGTGQGGSGQAGGGSSGGGAPAPPPASTTRTYSLVGGDVALRFTADGVTVVYATPRPGFTVELSESHDTGARVEFEGEDHRSRLEGWWDGGPVDEVREDGES